MNPTADLTPADDLPIDPDLPEPPRRARTPKRVPAAIAAGGALGGPARYGLGLAFPTAPHTFPAVTFAINVLGSFVLALLLVFVLDIWPPTTYVRPFLCVGFLGAFTTFSTWMVDTDRLISAGAYGTAAGYLSGSLAVGLAATSLGLSLGRGIASFRRKNRTAARVPAAQAESAQAEPAQIGGRR